MMKLFFASMLLVTMAATAQPPRAPPHPDHRGPGMEAMEPASPVRRLLQTLREKNPAEFERLQKLRRENPQAFRDEIRDRMQGQALENLKTRRPAIYDAVQHLSAEDRAWLFERISASGGPPHPGNKNAKGGREMKRDADQVGVPDLVQAYHDASDDRQREVLREQIAAELGRRYDERLQFRREQVEELREKINDLEATLQSGEEERARFIEERMDVLLNQE